MSAEPPVRIFLSPPHVTGTELARLREALDSNWVAPLGPHVDAFEHEFAEVLGGGHSLALSSGTAALHLALLEAGVGPGDRVFVSDLTFAASVFPIRYVAAEPVFVDSDRSSWNMDPQLLVDGLDAAARTGRMPKAVVLVHLLGQPADVDPILAACAHHGVAVIEDAAEALGARYRGQAPGTFGQSSIFSFNGNKIITTSGGGMLVSRDEALIEHARKLSTQARDPAPHYEHSEIGYNYRMSNLLAGVGRAQLDTLDTRVAARRANFVQYEGLLAGCPGLDFMPEPEWSYSTRWLTCLTLDEDTFGADREAVRQALAMEGIQARPVWKPMHLQPVFEGCERLGGAVSADLFERGLCLPSGSTLTTAEIEEIAAIVKGVPGSGMSASG